MEFSTTALGAEGLGAWRDSGQTGGGNAPAGICTGSLRLRQALWEARDHFTPSNTEEVS